MPEATSFTALGAGNGLPSCPNKVDVSGYDYWTTFSGWSKVSAPVGSEAEAESIDESRRLAMRLYWNLESVTNSANATFTHASLPYESSSVTIGSFSGEDHYEPRLRVCSPVSKTVTEISSPSGRTNCFTQAFSTAGVRMYDGATDDEDNFVGYGGGNSFFNTRSTASQRANSRVTLYGYRDTQTSGDGIFDNAYVEIGGIHCVCEAQAKGNVTESPDAANLTSSSVYTVLTTTYTANASISSLGFFTYPE